MRLALAATGRPQWQPWHPCARGCHLAFSLATALALRPSRGSSIRLTDFSAGCIANCDAEWEAQDCRRAGDDAVSKIGLSQAKSAGVTRTAG